MKNKYPKEPESPVMRPNHKGIPDWVIIFCMFVLVAGMVVALLLLVILYFKL